MQTDLPLPRRIAVEEAVVPVLLAYIQVLVPMLVPAPIPAQILVPVPVPVPAPQETVGHYIQMAMEWSQLQQKFYLFIITKKIIYFVI